MKSFILLLCVGGGHGGVDDSPPLTSPSTNYNWEERGGIMKAYSYNKASPVGLELQGDFGDEKSTQNDIPYFADFCFTSA